MLQFIQVNIFQAEACSFLLAVVAYVARTLQS